MVKKALLLIAAVTLVLAILMYGDPVAQYFKDAYLDRPPEEYFEIRKHTAELSQSERWHEDLDYLYKYLEVKHPNPYYMTAKSNFDQVLEEIHHSIDQLTDMQVMLEFRRLIALVQDGHTYLRLDPEDTGATTLPLATYVFSDGVFVTHALPPYEDLIGSKVTAIEGTAIETVAEILRPYDPVENEHWSKYYFPLRINVPAYLQALRISEHADQAEFSFQSADGSGFSRTIETISFDDLPEDFYRGRFLYDRSDEAPLSMQNLHENFWAEYFEDQSTVYIQFNAVWEKTPSGLSMKQFAADLEKMIDENEVEKVIVDVRYNGGGDTFTYEPLMELLVGHPKINKPDTLYTIISRNTFSAAVNFVTELEQRSEVIYVGSPTGNRPKLYGDCRSLKLPHSDLEACISTILWIKSFPEDERLTLPPDIQVDVTSEDFFNHRDPVLEQTLEL
jgi:hypothetical protein